MDNSGLGWGPVASSWEYGNWVHKSHAISWPGQQLLTPEGLLLNGGHNEKNTLLHYMTSLTEWWLLSVYNGEVDWFLTLIEVEIFEWRYFWLPGIHLKYFQVFHSNGCVTVITSHPLTAHTLIAISIPLFRRQFEAWLTTAFFILFQWHYWLVHIWRRWWCQVRRIIQYKVLIIKCWIINYDLQ